MDVIHSNSDPKNFPKLCFDFAFRFNRTCILDITLLAREDNLPAAFETPSLKSCFIVAMSGP